MDSVMITTVACTQSLYKLVSPVYKAIPKPANCSIVIEITSADGKTSSKEIITTNRAPKWLTSSIDSLVYNLKTIFLFTYSDAKTVLLPWVLFGVGHALSAHLFGLRLNSSTLQILSRIPQVLAWLWLNLLPFDISNQCQPSAVEEDRINKPWRPIPSKRITETQSYFLMLIAYAVAFLFSLRYGGASQCIMLAICGVLYNRCHGSDITFFSRHVLNALGFISFGSGAMEVAFGRSVYYSPVLVQWLRIIGLIIFTGIQTADMYDEEGDALANRHTLPLVIGDEPARWCTAISTIAWSIFCPRFWELGIVGYALPMVGGLIVANRTLSKRSVVDDKKTYKLWNLWLVAIYCLPLAKVIGTAILA